MAKQRIRKKPMSQINVVPYIDVSLVLLLIFMITTPLLTQGVKVNLPQASAKPLPPSQIKPLVVSIKRDGSMYLNVGDHPSRALGEQVLMARVAAVLRNRPATQVVVKGDDSVPYGRVVRVMTLLQAAGAPSVGLMTKPPGAVRRK